ncbi:MAG: hypothetical protein EBX36_11430 [Planctomycetia bacterium]|nr:hypothetical protein [Planctomycetia bacterium]
MGSGALMEQGPICEEDAEPAHGEFPPACKRATPKRVTARTGRSGRRTGPRSATDHPGPRRRSGRAGRRRRRRRGRRCARFVAGSARVQHGKSG